MYFITVRYGRFLFLAICLLLFSADGFTQRYNFEQYDIEDGLIQSQVTALSQDHKRRLWISTLGGVSSFNGRQFTNFTKINGLNNNFVLSVTAGSNNNVYIGSSRGLSKYNGHSFYNYRASKNWLSKLITDGNGNSYAISGKHLFKINDRQTQEIRISGDSTEHITAIATGRSGQLWAAIHGKGLYYLENNKWKRQAASQKIQHLVITDLLIDGTGNNRIWLLSTEGIHIIQDKEVRKAYPEISYKCNSIEQDAKGAIWIGTNYGAYYITPTQTTHFTAGNGFCDNVVNTIFRDAENNIWLGTDGSGLFRFTSNSYVTFDETQGIDNRIVMAIAKGPKPGSVWLGSYGGLYEYQPNRKIKKLSIPSGNENSYRINFLYNDRKKNTWIGTVGGGLWLADAKQIRRISNTDEHIAYNGITEAANGDIWLSTSSGCFIYTPHTRTTTQITKKFEGGLLEIGRDSMLSGTQDGAILIINKKKTVPLNIKELNGSNILCILKDKENILFGTTDYGLIIWNQKTGKTRSINTRSGLSSDHIYSLLKDRNGIIWVGTGKGINRLRSADYSVSKTNSEDSPLVECNQNSIFQDDNKIWIGTTKGVIIFDLNPSHKRKINPYIFINSVNIITSNKTPENRDGIKTSYTENELAKTLILPYNHNRININYTGIHLSNPNDLLYQYRLTGLDNKFSQASTSSSMSFTAIPAGKYTFQVRAITRTGLKSVNNASFSFEILPPYYQTNIFRISVVFLIILIIMLTVYLILKLNERRRKLRLRIKLEEQFKIRKQTAEDFHDDLGNKLTRITVLSEVLGSMIDKDDTEKRSILQKISQNVDELYNGTKDILWSLNPKNDTLIQLLDHIKEFGTEMFNNTKISFSHDLQPDQDSRLSLNMSRNILMIFKEAIHNALKHSKATQVHFHVHTVQNILHIRLQDNGSGFDAAHHQNGHGINNMYIRAQRINTALSLKSDQNGTTVSLNINFPDLTYSKNA